MIVGEHVPQPAAGEEEIVKRSRPQLTTIAVPVLVLVGCSQSLSPAAPTYMFADDHATVLERDWVANKNGTVLYAPTALRATVVQVRPDVADPPSLTDVRVRRALAYGIDGATANDVLNAGRGLLTATLTSPKVDYYARI
ncbi:MAG: hypothetical protein QOF51_1231, partial [Chloroflexota bacterium]|nr:hypothetical protein [Chloroflexota bacterium]